MPIGRKLTVVILLSASVAVALAGTVAISYEFIRYRQAIVRDMITQADIIGQASAAALAFRDAKAAEETLSALKVRREIESARLYGPDGNVFVEYVREGATVPLLSPSARTEGHRFEGGGVVVDRHITLGNDTVGTIRLQADLHEERARLISYVSIAGMVILALLFVTLLISAGLQRIISKPILDLASLAQRVSAEHDYSLRAARRSDDEIGVLVDGFNQMLTQVQQRDDELRASEERFRQLAENIREVFWMTDKEKTQMLYVSPGYEEIWGRSRESLYGTPRSWVDAIHPDDRARVSQAAMTKQERGDYDEQYRIVRPDDSVRWIRDRAFPIRDETGAVYRIVGVAEDITERKRLEEQIIQAEKMESVGHLAAGVAHEVKNPLMALAMGVDYFALAAEGQSEETAAVVHDMKDAIERADSIIMGLLDFAATRELHTAPEDLNKIVDVCAGLVRHELARSHVTFVRELADALPPLSLDKNKITQVFVNLFMNAIHAMPPGGQLIVRTYSVEGAAGREKPGEEPAARLFVGSGVAVEIDDTGIGIPPAELPKVFDPFFTTKGPGKGTGLGLTVVRQIIQLHGGESHVNNRPEGGVRVSIMFPINRRNPNAKQTHSDH